MGGLVRGDEVGVRKLFWKEGGFGWDVMDGGVRACCDGCVMSGWRGEMG